MKLRVLVPGLLALITFVAAAASMVSGSVWIAGGVGVSVIAIAGLAFARIASPTDPKVLLESLRVAQRAGGVAVNSVLTPKIIFVAKSAISDVAASGHLMMFRDEMDASLWRELNTLLRHQTQAQSEPKKVHQVAAHRLGKSFDL